MVGQVLGAVGHLPNIYTELEVSYYLLRRLLGVRTEGMSTLYMYFILGSACFGPPGSGPFSQSYGFGSFPFLINVLGGLK
jgi:hypothetical protein